MVIDRDCAAEVLEALSVTVTLKEETPPVVGTPLIVPVAALSDNPAGSDPLVTAQLL